MRFIKLFAGLTLVTGLLAAPLAEGQTNLLVNGDFELGNLGFSSGYNYSLGNLIPGQAYDVVQNPNTDNANGASFGDHTTGAGFMMAFNGGGVGSTQVVWSETINTSTNTTYSFAGWGVSWGELNGSSGYDETPARLVVVINGLQQGPVGEVIAQDGVWTNFNATWNSESSTQAVIQIFNLSSGVMNCFAIDDLSFASLSPKESTPTAIFPAVELNWASVSNTVYQVQWVSSLSATNWINLGSPVTATGTNNSVWDRTATGTRLYRVISF